MTKPGGLSMHYVVPKKWTNMREDRSVYRDNCVDILMNRDVRIYGIECKKYGKKFVFPAWGKDSWECSKFMSKGFILWIHKYKPIDQYVANRPMMNLDKIAERVFSRIKKYALENIT
jgi:hypothetical protein